MSLYARSPKDSAGRTSHVTTARLLMKSGAQCMRTDQWHRSWISEGFSTYLIKQESHLSTDKNVETCTTKLCSEKGQPS